MQGGIPPYAHCGTIYTEDGTPRLAYYHRRAD